MMPPSLVFIWQLLLDEFTLHPYRLCCYLHL